MIIRTHQFVAGALLAACAAMAAADADMLLYNGKIATVDDHFSIVQALVVKDRRVVATGSNAAMKKLAGPQARKIDLHGKTVIPGLIDNHAHFVRAAQQWGLEVRWDGVTSRKAAADMLRARARSAPAGEWIAVLGGWSYDQFTDDQRPFTRAELDEIAPENPVALQLVYISLFLNSQAVEALGVNDPNLKIAGARVVRDTAGAPTGVIEGGGGSNFLRTRIPSGNADTQIDYTRKLLAELNRMGLTTVIDWGGYGFTDERYAPFEALHKRGELNVRVFHGTWNAPTNPEQTELVVERIKTLTPLQGDDWFDNLGYGETVFLPLHDNPSPKGAKIAPEQIALWRKIAQAVADRGLNLSVHANQVETIDAFLTEIEAINKIKPIKGLRWSIAHARSLNASHVERMRKLGMYVMLHSQANISGGGLLRAYGDEALDQTPIRMVQDSALPWGLGSDSNGAAPANPFLTLNWAVTGKMLSGKRILRHTISREEALIAHTRANAYFAFQEANLGQLVPGKYADLLVLDRDYFKVPADRIRDLQPVMTMVGGKIVYAAPPAKTSQAK
jgi:predicted amidohydrolase YtcJ